MYAAGYNYYGQLGLGTDTRSQYAWTRSTYNGGVVDVKAGSYHSVLLKSNGNAYLCGHFTESNQSSNHRDWTKEYSTLVTAIDAGGDNSLVKKTKNNDSVFFNGRLRREYVPWTKITDTDISLMSVSLYSGAMVVKDNNDLYVMGYNDYGQLGIPLSYNDDDGWVADWVKANKYLY